VTAGNKLISGNTVIKAQVKITFAFWEFSGGTIVQHRGGNIRRPGLHNGMGRLIHVNIRWEAVEFQWKQAGCLLDREMAVWCHTCVDITGDCNFPDVHGHFGRSDNSR
jgi:hypothetical protein